MASSSGGVLPAEKNRRHRRKCGLCSWLCCCCCCNGGARTAPSTPLPAMNHLPPDAVGGITPTGMGGMGGHGVAGMPHGAQGRLSEEVYRRIRAVDQQNSTLTSGGLQGLSARVLDKSEFRQPPSQEVQIIQLVEIIKKPGQSLGLYLREGNGVDRPTGVFASRFGENSELAKYGDVIRPGDEIMSINNVEVSSMGIDDVVLILSIPRRLLLRIRYIKHRRSGSQAASLSSERPVVVFHKLEERRESDALMGSNPTPTANTSLGKRARQQQQEMMQRGVGMSGGGYVAPGQMGGTMGREGGYAAQHGTLGREGMQQQHPQHPVHSLPHPTPYATATLGRGSPRYQNHSPRLLNGMGEAVIDSHRFSEPDALETVSRTARVPPPRIGLAQVRRAESFSSQPTAGTVNPLYTLPRSSTHCPPPADPLLSRSLCSPVLPRPLRSFDHKSNSLPRRRVVSAAGPRNVKWRTDVVGCEGDESDSAVSAPEYAGYRPNPLRLSNGAAGGRTVNEIFSAAEYRNWADPTDPRYGMMGPSSMTMGRQGSRWSHAYAEPPRGPRSSSLPGRTIMTQSLVGSPMTTRAHPPPERPSAVLDRYHVSPLMNRRAPLRAAGPSINVDRLNVHSLTGILFVQILEGRGLKMPDKQRAVTEEMYCVLEVDEAHRARTGVSTAEQRFRWRETFHIDVYDATTAHFFVYSWHPQYRHKLCHKGSLKLLEAFIVDQLNGDRMFALNLEPRGQLIVRIGFHDMPAVFRRTVNCRMDGVFGVPLSRLITRERRDTPIVLTRLLQEIERRGVDYNGLYVLCGSVEKKRVLREELELDPAGTDLSLDSVPDTNVLACLVKDLLRELPEPLVPVQIHSMLLDAAAVALPNDTQGNRQLVLRIVDCLPCGNKNTLLLLLDHLSQVLCSSPHNGLSPTRLSATFGPLIFCTADGASQIGHNSPGSGALGCPAPKEAPRPLDAAQAASTLKMLLNVWPQVSDSPGGPAPAIQAGAPIHAAFEARQATNRTLRAPALRSRNMSVE